jgi:hypothetical protein
MWRVPNKKLGGWHLAHANHDAPQYPTTAVVVCPSPECHEPQAFHLGWPMQMVQDNPTIKSLCPHCRQQIVVFVMVDPGPTEGEHWEGEVWMHPDPPVREALALEGLVPERLMGRYQESLDAFRAGLWTFAAQGARATLEGLVKYQLGADVADRRTLHQLLVDLATTTDLGRPIADAGAVLKVGGNLASHYGPVDVDRETAAAVLDLLDAFFEYLVLVPLETERARRTIEQARAADAAGDVT